MAAIRASISPWHLRSHLQSLRNDNKDNDDDDYGRKHTIHDDASNNKNTSNYHYDIRSNCNDRNNTTTEKQQDWHSSKKKKCDKAKDIFYGSTTSNKDDGNNDYNAKTIRKGFVDGEIVTFELKENITNKPKSSTTKRQRIIDVTCINMIRSPWDVRIRCWLLKFNVPTITFFYLATFVGMNFIFAALWSIQDGKCCNDSDLTYTQIFDFAIQTSTTIGYGGYVPDGNFSHFLVFLNSFLTLVLNTVYGGLLFLKFVSSTAKLEFSNIITYSNVNGLPCLEFRIGNKDGSNNRLLNVHVRFTYSYTITYIDEKSVQRDFGHTQELILLSNRRNELSDTIWTLRHIIDETSPLFGIDLLQYPGTNIYEFRVGFHATQEVTGASIYNQILYEIDDIVIGQRFQDQITVNRTARTAIIDYALMNEIQSQPVWYPIIQQGLVKETKVEQHGNDLICH